MKVLIVHNFYGSTAPSGENLVVEAESALLRSRGHDVALFARHSDDIRSSPVLGTLRGALATPWNPWMASAIADRVRTWQPDVVHVHNTFPLISPAIFAAIGRRSARVLTLHNYRLLCPAAIPVRDGHVCTECLDRRSAWPALRHGCYRGNRVATLPLAVNVALHRTLGTWQHQVDAFIALSEFQRRRMIDGGLPVARMHVKPNFYPGRPAVLPWAERGAHAVFAGRLTAEKGVLSLVRAWRLWQDRFGKPPELLIIGDGPLREELENMASDLPIVFMGQLPASVAQQQIARARLLILPSECFEGFPMVIREAFAFGTPVAVSDLGPLPSIVTQGVDGMLFSPGDPASLAATVQHYWEKPNTMQRLAVGARDAFEQTYTEEKNYEILRRIYESAIKTTNNCLH